MNKLDILQDLNIVGRTDDPRHTLHTYSVKGNKSEHELREHIKQELESEYGQQELLLRSHPVISKSAGVLRISVGLMRKPAVDQEG